MAVHFEWDEHKNLENRSKHGVSFELAKQVFFDPRLIITEDVTHSITEKRYFAYGKAGDGILTVRFTMRKRVVRLFGAAYWRKGKKIYEQENNL